MSISGEVEKVVTELHVGEADIAFDPIAVGRVGVLGLLAHQWLTGQTPREYEAHGRNRTLTEDTGAGS